MDKFEITLANLNEVTGWELQGFDQRVVVHRYGDVWTAEGLDQGIGVTLGNLSGDEVKTLRASAALDL